MEVSNKVLGVLVFSMFIVSLGGFMLNTRLMDDLEVQFAPLFSGAPTSTGSGRVNLSVSSTTAISVTDGLIRFGACTPVPGAGSYFSSNSTLNAIDNTTGLYNCSTMMAPDNITVRNIGNGYLNLTITFAGNGSFLGGNTPRMWYATYNEPTRPGCINTTECLPPGNCGCNTAANCSFQNAWNEVTTTTPLYKACNNISYTAGANDGIIMYVRLFVPYDAPVSPGTTEKTQTMTLTGTSQ